MEEKRDIHRTTLYIPFETLQKLRRLAAKHRRSVNSEIVYVLDSYLTAELQSGNQVEEVKKEQ